MTKKDFFAFIWNSKYLTISATTLCIRAGTMSQKNARHSPKYYKSSTYSFNIQVSMESYRLSMWKEMNGKIELILRFAFVPKGV